MVRKLFTALLAAGVLVSTLAGVGAHQHTAETFQFAAACLVDHHEEHDHDHSTGHFWEAAGHEHEHECVACHAGRDRTEVSDSALRVAPWQAAGDAAVAPVSAPRARAHLPSAARGPPAASLS